MPAGYEWGWDNGRALIGIVLIYGLCWVLSEKRKLFPWKIVLGATAMQFAFALILGLLAFFALSSFAFELLLALLNLGLLLLHHRFLILGFGHLDVLELPALLLRVLPVRAFRDAIEVPLLGTASFGSGTG